MCRFSKEIFSSGMLTVSIDDDYLSNIDSQKLTGAIIEVMFLL